MARNKVQFQKSMSIYTFIQRYGDEAQCQQRLFDIRWPQGFQCPNCGHTH
ncbi:transposase, partial [Pseudaeromonas pectinilytica]